MPFATGAIKSAGLSTRDVAPANHMTLEQIDVRVREERHKVVYRHESKMD